MLRQGLIGKIVERSREIFIRTREIQNPQMEFLLLGCCTGSQQLNYWLRTCDSAQISEEVHDFDAAVDDTLYNILGTTTNTSDRDLIQSGGYCIAKF